MLNFYSIMQFWIYAGVGELRLLLLLDCYDQADIEICLTVLQVIWNLTKSFNRFDDKNPNVESGPQ